MADTDKNQIEKPRRGRPRVTRAVGRPATPVDREVVIALLYDGLGWNEATIADTFGWATDVIARDGRRESRSVRRHVERGRNALASLPEYAVPDLSVSTRRWLAEHGFVVARHPVLVGGRKLYVRSVEKHLSGDRQAAREVLGNLESSRLRQQSGIGRGRSMADFIDRLL